MQKGMQAFRFPKATIRWASLSILSVGVAHAVMIRHDVAEENYFELAKRPEFAAGLTAVHDHRGTYSGVLVGGRYIMTAGHPVAGYMRNGNKEGPMTVKVRIQGFEYESEYAFLHPDYPHKNNCGGADLAIVRLKENAGLKTQAATLFGGSLKIGDRITGVGQGKTGTGNNNNEPNDGGLFRGYENTVDYFHNDEFTHFRADFDNGTDHFNTLSRVVYGSKPPERIQGRSSKTPLPLEGSCAAGDSGSCVWVEREGKFYLVGISTYRIYSMYGGQSAYVNLSNSSIMAWIKSIAKKEEITFKIRQESVKSP
jgi:hypothetical protein